MLKRYLSLIIVVIIIMSSIPGVFQASAANVGDINSDGDINTTDYLLLKRYVLGTGQLTDAQLALADVDNDGDVDRLDYVTLKRIVLGTLESSVNTSVITGVSYSKPYSKAVEASSTYPDTNNELTDGYIPTSADYTDPGYNGYSGSDITVTIDLGEDGTRVTGFEFHYLILRSAGIFAPTAVTISGADSLNGTFTQIAYRAIVSDGIDGAKVFSLELTASCNYRYIKFYIAKNTAWTFLAETVVYGAVEIDTNAENPYDTQLTDSAQTTYINSVKSTSSYNANTGIKVISGGCSTSINHNNYDSRCGYSSSRFTDSSVTGSHSESGKWNGINTATATTLTLTLSSYSAKRNVCGFEIHCFNRPSASINLPAYVDISVSNNGSTYYKVGRVYAPETDQENFAYKLHFNRLFTAKKVRFSFPATEGCLWIEELSVYGNTSPTSTSVSTTGYLNSSPDVLGGVEDVALIYFNAGDTDSSVTRDMILPYVGYLDENGNVIDTMFDGFLFLPQVASMACNGHTPYGTNCATDWKWYYNEIFKSGCNLEALNQAAEMVKLLLGKTELKLKVFLTIPHMDYSLSNFGDINGDGTNEIVNTHNGRVATATLYAEMLKTKFESMGYANLELCGYYWFHEEISDRDWENNYTGDAQTAKAVTASIEDATGLPMFWIPYYQALGYTSGYSYGFEAVCYQPNYAFSLDVAVSRLADAAATARKYGMCIEIEAASGADTDYRYFQKYMDYLSCGAAYGYMNNSIHMYYQEFDVIGRTWDDPGRSRLLYTYTYQFMKGTLDVTPDTAPAISVSVSKNNPSSFTVNTQQNDRQIYTLSCSPAHGSIAFAEDGSYVYYPNKDYTGTDSFKYKISNYLGWSAECTVNITVE